MQPFLRPEAEFREYQALLQEIRDFVEKIKRDIEGMRDSISKSEKQLAEAMAGDGYAHVIKGEIEKLLKDWARCRDELKSNPGDSEVKTELRMIEDDLVSLTEQKLKEEAFQKQEIQMLRDDILQESKFLRALEEHLESWEQDKMRVMQDMDLLQQKIGEFKKMFESKN